MLFSDQELLMNNHTKGLNQLHAEDLTSAQLFWMVLEEMKMFYMSEFFWVLLGRGQLLVIFA